MSGLSRGPSTDMGAASMSCRDASQAWAGEHPTLAGQFGLSMQAPDAGVHATLDADGPA